MFSVSVSAYTSEGVQVTITQSGDALMSPPELIGAIKSAGYTMQAPNPLAAPVFKPASAPETPPRRIGASTDGEDIYVPYAPKGSLPQVVATPTPTPSDDRKALVGKTVTITSVEYNPMYRGSKRWYAHGYHEDGEIKTPVKLTLWKEDMIKLEQAGYPVHEDTVDRSGLSIDVRVDWRESCGNAFGSVRHQCEHSARMGRIPVGSCVVYKGAEYTLKAWDRDAHKATIENADGEKAVYCPASYVYAIVKLAEDKAS